jgi:hypothetical protein
LKGNDLIGIAQTGTGKTLSQLHFYCFKSIVSGLYIVAFNDGHWSFSAALEVTNTVQTDQEVM